MAHVEPYFPKTSPYLSDRQKTGCFGRSNLGLKLELVQRPQTTNPPASRNVNLLAIWGLLDGIWGVFERSSGLQDHGRNQQLPGPPKYPKQWPIYPLLWQKGHDFGYLGGLGLYRGSGFRV